MFCNKLLDKQHDLNMILNTDDVNVQVSIFNKVFNECLNECAPMVTREVGRPYAPWISEAIKLEIVERNNLRSMLKKDRSNVTLIRKYKEKKKHVKVLLYTAKTDYTKEEINKCKNSKDTWKAIRKIVPNKCSKNHMYDNIENALDKFNTHFANIGRQTYEKTQEVLLNVEQQSEMDDIEPEVNRNVPLFRPQPVDVNHIILIVHNLNNGNSCGSDGISSKFIKDSLFVLAFYITILVNTSIVTGIYPSLWKHSLVTPLLKQGDLEDPNNFRPVSILPVISKVLERVVAEQLMTHFESNKLLSNNQHGFRKRLSTETALIKVTDQIYKNIDDKKISLLILCDLSKAFDSVCHPILLQKLFTHAVDSFWFEDYLKDRRQSVRIDNIASNPLLIEYGIPQGSILGPILFLPYVDDLVLCMNDGLLFQYADDTQLLLSDTIENIFDLIKRAEKLLSRVEQYFLRIGLLLNKKKTQCIFIGSPQYISKIPENIIIKLGNENIIPSRSVKNLGLYMDSLMTFSTHMDNLCKKVNGILMYINRVKESFSESTRIQIVQSLVLSVMDYCLVIWGTTNRSQLERAQRLMNFAARVAVEGVRKYDRISPTIKQLKWLKSKEKNLYVTCIMVFKVLNSHFPDWFCSFETMNERIDRNTRQSNHLHVGRIRTDLGSRSFLVNGPFQWNKLPHNIRNCNSISVFKNKLKEYMLNRQNASIS